MASDIQDDGGYDVPVQLHPHTAELAALLLHDDREGASRDAGRNSKQSNHASGASQRPLQQGWEPAEPGSAGQATQWVSPPALSALREQAKLLQQQKRAKQRQHLTLDASPGRFELAPGLQERQQAGRRGDEDSSLQRCQLVGVNPDAPTPTYRRGRDGGVLVPLRMMASLLISDTAGAGAATAAAAAGTGAAAASAGAGAEKPRRRGIESEQQPLPQLHAAQGQQLPGEQSGQRTASKERAGSPASSTEGRPRGDKATGGAGALPPPSGRLHPPGLQRRASAPGPQPEGQHPPPQHRAAAAAPAGGAGAGTPPAGASSAAAVSSDEGRGEPRVALIGEAGPPATATPAVPTLPPAARAALERRLSREEAQPTRPHSAQPVASAAVARAWQESAAAAAVSAPRLLQRTSVSPQSAQAAGRGGALLPAPLSAEHAFLGDPAAAHPPRSRSLSHHHSLPRTLSHPHPHTQAYPQPQFHSERQQPHPQFPQYPQYPQLPLRGSSCQLPVASHLGQLRAAAVAVSGGGGGSAAMEDEDEDADGAMLIDVGAADRAAEGALLPTPERPRSAAAAAAAGAGWDALRGLGLRADDTGGGDGDRGIAATLALLSPGGGGGAAGRSQNWGLQQQRLQQQDERMAELTSRLEADAEAQQPEAAGAAGGGVSPGEEADGGFDADDEGEEARRERAHRTLRLRGRSGIARQLPGLSSAPPWVPFPSSSAPPSATAAAAAASAPAFDRLGLAAFSALSLSAPAALTAGGGAASTAPPAPEAIDACLEELLRLKVSLRRALAGGGSAAAVSLILSLLAALPASAGALAASQVAALVAPLQQHACTQVAAAASHLMAVWKAVLKAAARQPAAPGGPDPLLAVPPSSRAGGSGSGPGGAGEGHGGQAQGHGQLQWQGQPPSQQHREQSGLHVHAPTPHGQLARSHSDVLLEGRGAGAADVGVGTAGAASARLGGEPWPQQHRAAVDLISAGHVPTACGVVGDPGPRVHTVYSSQGRASPAQLDPGPRSGAEAGPRRSSDGAAGSLEGGAVGGGGRGRCSGGSGMASGTTLSCSPTAAEAAAGHDPQDALRRPRLGSTGTTAGVRQVVPALDAVEEAAPAARIRSYSPSGLGPRFGGGGGGHGCAERENGGGAPWHYAPLPRTPDGVLLHGMLGAAPTAAATAALDGSGGGAAVGTPTAGLALLPPALLPHAPGRKRKGERSASRRGGSNPSKRAAAAGPTGHLAGPRPVATGLPLFPPGDPAGKPAPARPGLGGPHAPLSKRQRHHPGSGVGQHGSGGGGGGGAGAHHTATKVRRMSLLLSSLDLGGDAGGGDGGHEGAGGGGSSWGGQAGPLLAELEADADADADMGSQDEEAAMLTSDDDSAHAPAGNGSSGACVVGAAAPAAAGQGDGDGDGDGSSGRREAALAHGGFFGGVSGAGGGGSGSDAGLLYAGGSTRVSTAPPSDAADGGPLPAAPVASWPPRATGGPYSHVGADPGTTSVAAKLGPFVVT